MPVTVPFCRRVLIRVLPVLFGLFGCGPLLAQTSEFTLYVFNRGEPVQYIEVLVDGELRTWTDERGVATLQLDAGIHNLELRLQDAVVLEQQILAVRDEISQWIVDVTGGGSALYEVESSDAAVEAPGIDGSETPSNGPPAGLAGGS